MWLHLDLIRSMKEFCRTIFPVVDYAWSSIPTYPSGQIGYILCSKNKVGVSTPILQAFLSAIMHQVRFYDQNKALVLKLFMPVHPLELRSLSIHLQSRFVMQWSSCMIGQIKFKPLSLSLSEACSQRRRRELFLAVFSVQPSKVFHVQIELKLYYRWHSIHLLNLLHCPHGNELTPG